MEVEVEDRITIEVVVVEVEERMREIGEITPTTTIREIITVTEVVVVVVIGVIRRNRGSSHHHRGRMLRTKVRGIVISTNKRGKPAALIWGKERIMESTAKLKLLLKCSSVD